MIGMIRAFYIQPYVIADFDLLANLKLVGELGLLPLSVAVGTWLRLLDFLDVTVALAPVPPFLRTCLHLQFGAGPETTQWSRLGGNH